MPSYYETCIFTLIFLISTIFTCPFLDIACFSDLYTASTCSYMYKHFQCETVVHVYVFTMLWAGPEPQCWESTPPLWMFLLSQTQ